MILGKETIRILPIRHQIEILFLKFMLQMLKVSNLKISVSIKQFLIENCQFQTIFGRGRCYQILLN